MIEENQYHTTVLLRESVEALHPKVGGVYVDATFGGGGHTKLLLQQLDATAQVFAFDQDQDAAENLPKNETRLTFLNQNFRVLKKMLRYEGVRKVDGILADLGVSSHQLDQAERGFSYRFEATLDMRMNQSEGRTAADLLNKYSVEELQRILSEFGEVRNARTLAQTIVQTRGGKPYRNISDLLQTLHQVAIGDKIRYQSQVFQALRMEVNDEIGALKDFLQQSLEMLDTGGRLAVITFHSIEDRLVKNFMKAGNFEGEAEKDFYGNISRPFKILTKKPIEPSNEELKKNSRSRSSKLRIAEKL
ncbi:MAG: hypothetical protein RL757_860 [Bacteroidota bacterium]|jgi:16S rRNA (cytosine1402-N4)-methyltransferase